MGGHRLADRCLQRDDVALPVDGLHLTQRMHNVPEDRVIVGDLDPIPNGKRRSGVAAEAAQGHSGIGKVLDRESVRSSSTARQNVSLRLE
jgi:hypothetical protein